MNKELRKHSLYSESSLKPVILKEINTDIYGCWGIVRLNNLSLVHLTRWGKLQQFTIY